MQVDNRCRLRPVTCGALLAFNTGHVISIIQAMICNVGIQCNPDSLLAQNERVIANHSGEWYKLETVLPSVLAILIIF